MKTPRALNVVALLGLCSLSAGCAGFFDLFRASGDTAGSAASRSGAQGLEAAGDYAVRDVIAYVRSAGTVDKISSHAVQLPTHIPDSITRYQYEFPASCGGQVFRLYESMDTQILEYEYVSMAGPSYVIRDYAAGPSPFISAGLWSAYDHTQGGIGDMKIQFEDRGSGILRGTYSRGPVTGLDEPRQRELQQAYIAALHSVGPCISQ